MKNAIIMFITKIGSLKSQLHTAATRFVLVRHVFSSVRSFPSPLLRRAFSLSAFSASPERQERVINGRMMAGHIFGEVRSQLFSLAQGLQADFDPPRPPVLGYVLVGDNEDSHRYVALKKRACQKAGVLTKGAELPRNVSQRRLEEVVQEMNEDRGVSGIMVQLPLPEHLDPKRIARLIRVEKDVDGLHPVNAFRNSYPDADPN